MLVVLVKKIYHRKSFVQKNQEFTNDNLARENFNKWALVCEIKQESDFEKVFKFSKLTKKSLEMVIAFH